MKAMNFQDDILSNPIDNFKYHHVQVFDLTSMQDATKSCRWPELAGEPLRMELNFTYPLQHVTGFIVFGEECLWLQLTSLVLSEKISKLDNVSLQQLNNRIP